MRRFQSGLTGASALASVSALALAAALGMAPATALAADAPAAASSNSTTTVGEVVVTAQKRPEPVKTVPAAVSVLPAAQLETAGVTQLRDLNGLVPGLVVGGAFESGEFVVRGLSAGNDINPVTGLQIDGAPIGAVAYGADTAQNMPEIDPSSIAQIEVLKGPQGTLYGGSTLGGIVQYVTKTPNLDHAEGSIFAEGSDTEHGGGNSVVRGAFSAPIIQDKLAFQVSAYDDDLSGYIDDKLLGRDKFNDHRSYGGRAALLWQVNPDFKVELSDIYSHSNGYNDLVPYTQSGHPLNGDLQFDEGTLPVNHSTFNVTALNANYDLHWASLSYIGTYQTYHSGFATPYDASPISSLIDFVLPSFGGVTVPAGSHIGVAASEETRKWTSEVRLASPDEGRVRWLVGAFYNREQANGPEDVGVFAPDQSLAAAPLGSLLNFDLLTHLTETAGFGDLTFYITPDLDVTGGIRVGHISQDYEQLSTGSDFAAFNLLSTVFGLSPTPADTGLRTATEDFQTYLADVRYHISPNDMVYFRFATGFRPGGPNDTIPGLPSTFQPDTTKDYEIGWKTNFWDNKGYLDLSLYNIDWDSIQVQATVNGLSGEINGGTALSRGVEASVALRPVEGLNMTLSGAYNDAHLTEDAPGGVGNNGDPLPGAPKWSGAAGVNYEWELGDDWHPFVGGQARYVGSRHSYFEHSLTVVDYVAPAYTLVDLQVGVRRGPYEVTAFARNLGNERAQLGALNVGVPYVSIERPRTIGMSFSAHW